MNDSLTIYRLDAGTVEWMDQEVKRTGQSVETVVRLLIQRGIEAQRKAPQQQKHNDLDSLAGTWNEEEAAEFLQVVDDFERVDSTLWQ